VLGDTSRLGPRRTDAKPAPPAADETKARSRWLYRAGVALYAAARRLVPAPPEPPVEPREPVSEDGRLVGREVRAALDGRYGTTIRTSSGGQRSVTLFSAIPVTYSGRAVGAVLVSQSTYRILQDLYAVRLGIFKVWLASVALAIVLSLFVATTIARPLRSLRDEAAAILDRRGRLKGSFRLSQRSDEIGELSRALHDLTRRLEEHQRSLESFAQDVSHELKNPLASIRTAAEMLSETDDRAERRRFLAMASGEVRRMERVLSDLTEMTRIDARLEGEPTEPVSLNALLERICEGFRLRKSPVSFELETPPETIAVQASEERLAQVFENLLDNAASFSPPGESVRVRLSRERGGAEVTVSDRGPGIPPEHLSRIFDRFFTWRPDAPAERDGGHRDRHTGLGLSIVRTIVEGYGGTVTAESEPGARQGATFTVRMPASRTGVFPQTPS
jgi:two-component system sensor histidine kinase ChvG